MEQTQSNVYAKLSKACFLLSQRELKKTGKGQYNYAELADFLRDIHEINHEVGLCLQLIFTRDEAILYVVNTENPEDVIEFCSPVVKAQLVRADEIKALGATQTYIRRYLILMAYQIAIPDMVDAQPPVMHGLNVSKHQLVPRGTVEQIRDDLPMPSIAERVSQIEKLWAVKALETYWKSLSPEIASNPQILEALKQRKAQISGETKTNQVDQGDSAGAGEEVQ